MADLRTEQASFEWSAERPASPAGEAGRAPSAAQPPEQLVPMQRACRPRLNTGERLERWLTADEATAHLGFPSRKALYAAVERGQVPGHKLGRRLRFSRSELDALLGRR
jgi:excisionase family DNA binding protein